jgi:hypothetical protein
MLATSVAVRVAGGAAGFIVVLACAILSTVTQNRMVNEVNSQLPTDARFSPFGWYLSKTLRLFGEYRRLYPSGSLIRRFRWLAVGASLGMALLAISIGAAVGGLMFGVLGPVAIWLMVR